MNRSDLESRVQITWERLNDHTDRCVGTLEATSDCHVDWTVAKMSGIPKEALRAAIENEARRRVVASVLGDLEAENLRLRAAVEKWGRRALNRKHWKDSEGEEDELKEDMK